jgi:hypothetical protein
MRTDLTGRYPFMRRLMRRLRARSRESTSLGIGLKPGSQHYRAFVGPPADYDLIAGLTAGLLFALGLREHHMLADLGCGSLRVGRLLIPYLRPRRYHGFEPNMWLVSEGIKRELGRDLIRIKHPEFHDRQDFGLAAVGVQFDFVLAQSVFSHTYPDLLLEGARGVATGLSDDGILVATYKPGKPTETGSGWLYPGVVTYEWTQVAEVFSMAGLSAHLVDWPHPRQRWFVAGVEGDRAKALSMSVRSPRVI